MLFNPNQEITNDFLSLKTRNIYLKLINIAKNVSITSTNTNDIIKVVEWLDIWKYLYHDDKISTIKLKEGVFDKNAETIVKLLQEKWGMPVNGIADPVFFSILSCPMAAAFQKSLIDISSIRTAIVHYAKQHRASVPLEVFNKDNYGPWVKAYLQLNTINHTSINTHDWCCGFICTILDQAFSHFNEDYTNYIPRSAWVPDIASYAHKNDIIIPYNQANDRIEEIASGDIFMVYDAKSAVLQGTPLNNRYKHIGLIEKIEGSIIYTIEGNKNFIPAKNNVTIENNNQLYIDSKIPANKGGVFSGIFDLSNPLNNISIVKVNI